MLLFRSKGLEATTIKEITEAAGVSVGNFYHYFSSKNDVLAENFHEADEIFLALRESPLFKTHGSERIVEYLCVYAKLVVSVGFDFSKELYTYKTKLFHLEGRPMQTVLTALIAACQAEGCLLPEPPAEEICRYLFIGARGLILDWCIDEGEGDLVAMMAINARRHLCAFLAPGR